MAKRQSEKSHREAVTRPPLEMLIADEIAARGSMSLERYMTLALTHPDYGYYTTRDPLGAAGDFTTGPEISQMFGEMTGVWMADSWQRLGCPAHPVLAEMGPGRGTLMGDMVRAVKSLPAFAEASSIHLIETSPVLQRLQKQKVPDATFHSHSDDLPNRPLFLVANEFFDALAIRQFEHTGHGWHERLIALDQSTSVMPFRRILSEQPTPPDEMTSLADETLLKDAPVGHVIETSPTAQNIIAGLAHRLTLSSGVVLIIDYGRPDSAPGDSFQAVRDHKAANPLQAPGCADLTAHVDFARLAAIARKHGAQIMGPVTQGAFLKALGIEERAARLHATTTPAQGRDIKTALHRLTSPSEMGTLFKVMALASPTAPLLSGFPSHS